MSIDDALYVLDEKGRRRVPDDARVLAAAEALDEGIRRGADDPMYLRAAAELKRLAENEGALIHDEASQERALFLAKDLRRLIEDWEKLR